MLIIIMANQYTLLKSVNRVRNIVYGITPHFKYIFSPIYIEFD